jgi:hypothetical protein
LPVSDVPFKPFFKDQVIIDNMLPDSRKNGAWLLTENQGLLYAANNPKVLYLKLRKMLVVNQ